MWDEDIIVPIGFFITVIVLAVVIPLVRALGRKWEREAGRPELPRAVAQRLARIEQAVDAIAIEVERISEGQRFLTKVMTDNNAGRALGAGAAQPVEIESREPARVKRP